ncbi:hypothetical protein CAEBREN_22733 [Caenorhabditis brenneri]|uniref:F-box domain-containing protein n=1 Tax=Caenorhabditis brenneri TaxID=135651 RepID=G0P3B5_CAEBE|nr:hypothetical protein CAEBREN_22733 [Caenorhabditis brenneri]
MDWEYNPFAIEGFLFCLFLLKVSAERAYSDLLKITKREERCLECVKSLFNWMEEEDYDIKAGDDEYQRSKGFLYCLYLREVSPDYAFLELQLAGGSFSLKDVRIMFKRMEEGKYNMEQVVVSRNPREAFGILPDEIKVKVIEFLNLESRLAFRQTSSKNRQLVDTGKFFIGDAKVFDSRWTLHILASDYTINWDLAFNQWFMYKKFKDYVILPEATETEVHSKFQKEISLIFNSNKKLKIGKLDIRVTSPEKGYYPERFIVPSANRVRMPFNFLRVTTLNLEGFTIQLLLNFLKKCDPTILKHVTRRSNFVGRPVMKFWKRKNAYKKLYGLEQWKNLDEFVDKDDRHICDNLASSFAHLAYADVTLYSDPPLEQILELREKLLLKPTLDEMTLNFNFSVEKFEELCEHFGIFNIPPLGNAEWVIYGYPNSEEVLSLCVTPHKVIFRGPYFNGRIRSR